MEERENPPIVSVIGRSGSGKTTFLVRLIDEFKSRGFRVAVIKHSRPRKAAHGELEFDRPGKDTWHHFNAGADTVILATADRLAMVHRLSQELPPDVLSGILPEPVDIMFTEGFKRGGLPAIEVARNSDAWEPVGNPAHRIALVTGSHLPQSEGTGESAEFPWFSTTDAASVADFLIGRLNLIPSGRETRSSEGR